MNLASLAAQLEEERAWRQEEILFLQNQVAVLEKSDEKNQLRRACILLVYAHFEGFCKFALSLYVDAINALGIRCGAANFALAAASLADAFGALRDSNTKCAEFRNELPDDSKLHRFARDREFIERSSEIDSRIVSIPEGVVDTESNLKPVVLKKNLYRLGLPFDQVGSLEREIGMLVGLRNNISHGSTRSGIDHNTYEKYRSAAFVLMSHVRSDILKALREKSYLRAPGVT